MLMTEVLKVGEQDRLHLEPSEGVSRFKTSPGSIVEPKQEEPGSLWSPASGKEPSDGDKQVEEED